MCLAMKPEAPVTRTVVIEFSLVGVADGGWVRDG